MKQRFSALDISVMVGELAPKLVGMRLANLYDINARTLLLKFQKPEKKEMVLLESGVRIHTTNYVRNKEQTPSGFNVKLRKHLRTRRLNSLKQLGQDRRIDLEFGEGEYSFHLIIEFFAAGNIILTDYEYRIMSVLRTVELKDQDPVQVGNIYNMENIFMFKPINMDILLKAITDPKLPDISSKKAKAKVQNLRNLLRSTLGPSYGPSLIELTISKAGLDPQMTNLECFSDTNSKEFQGLLTAFENTDGMILEPASENFRGYIVTENTETQDKSSVVYDEFHPFNPTHMNARVILEYESFNEAVDEFFSKIESQRLEQKAKQAEMHAIKKLEAVKQNNLNQIKNFQMSQEEKQLKAAAIEVNLDMVDSAIKTVCSFVASGMDWVDLKELINEEKANGNPLALIIEDLKLAVGMITLKLPNPEVENDSSDDDSDDSSEDVSVKKSTLLVDVDIYQSAFANARSYYTAKKVAIEKEKKTILASAKALDNAEKKIMKNLASKELNSAKITKYRCPMWFEKFLWFITTENYLVIGGRDDNQNELLITKYLQPGDVYVHSDLEGSSPVIVKAVDKELRNYISITTLNQAAAMCLCNSKAWDSKIVTSAYWVKSNQVTKMSYAGDSMPLGKFRILGEKNFLPATQLLMGIGLLFEIENAENEHFHERRPWAVAGTISLADIQSSFIDVFVDPEERVKPISPKTEGTEVEIQMTQPQMSTENCEQTPTEETNNLSEDEILQQPADTVKSNSPKLLTRGQKSKLKKMKSKYADQDEDDRKMMMELLGSAKGPQPKGKKAKAEVSKKIEQSITFKAKKPNAKKPPTAPTKKEDSSAITELPNINFDTLTSQPSDGDKVISCLPVCAPWVVLQKYHFKVKITPGSQKRGKAAKQVCNSFINFAEKNSKEEILEAIKLVPEQEWINVMLSKVKIGTLEKK
ncbi:hypothetical protein HDV04_003213 [Boothiomyces sp. JEL0838]|nr:hypothetical protein HDV04_003213 [Boothiomyces sp. JEL0838]